MRKKVQLLTICLIMDLHRQVSICKYDVLNIWNTQKVLTAHLLSVIGELTCHKRQREAKDEEKPVEMQLWKPEIIGFVKTGIKSRVRLNDTSREKGKNDRRHQQSRMIQQHLSEVYSPFRVEIFRRKKECKHLIYTSSWRVDYIQSL